MIVHVTEKSRVLAAISKPIVASNGKVVSADAVKAFAAEFAASLAKIPRATEPRKAAYQNHLEYVAGEFANNPPMAVMNGGGLAKPIIDAAHARASGDTRPPLALIAAALGGLKPADATTPGYAEGYAEGVKLSVAEMSVTDLATVYLWRSKLKPDHRAAVEERYAAVMAEEDARQARNTAFAERMKAEATAKAEPVHVDPQATAKAEWASMNVDTRRRWLNEGVYVATRAGEITRARQRASAASTTATPDPKAEWASMTPEAREAWLDEKTFIRARNVALGRKDGR